MPSNDRPLRITYADATHAALVLHFIRQLAEYEKLSHLVVATEQDLHRFLFGPDPVAEVLLAWWDSEAVGFALYFRTFSTFLARPGFYLEDLFVEPAFRGRGIGKALLLRLARLAAERGYGRVDWAVLNWNRPSIDFYGSLGAVPLDDWTTYRLTGDALHRCAQSAGGENL